MINQDQIFAIQTLPSKLVQSIYKRGYFLMSRKVIRKYWVDMFHLSHLFNAHEDAKKHYSFLKNRIEGILKFQIDSKRTNTINSVIIPRWTCSTEDLFCETLLNICFELFSDSETFKGLNMYELFSTGGGDKPFYYLNPVIKGDMHGSINAVSFFALDIHSWILDDFLSQKISIANGIRIPNVISVIGRCKPLSTQANNTDNKCNFRIVSLFDAWNELENVESFSYIMNPNSPLHRDLFINNVDAESFSLAEWINGNKDLVPFDDWEEEYNEISDELSVSKAFEVSLQ